MAVTMDARAYLLPQVIEGILNKKLEQHLDFLDVCREIRTDATSFRYAEDKTNAGDDISSGVMGTPAELTEEAQLATIDMSSITFKHGVLNQFGYKIEINPRVMRETGFVDEIQRAIDRAGFGIAKKINDDIVTVASAVSNDITEVSGAAVWSADDADPVGDILKFVKAMDLENYPYELNKLYLEKVNFYEMLDYLQGIDRRWSIDPTGGNARSIPDVQGVNLFNTSSSQLTHGSYLGFDTRYQPITCYMYLDPTKSSNPSDGRIMVNRFQEQHAPQKIIIEMTMEFGLAIPIPNAITYKSTGI